MDGRVRTPPPLPLWLKHRAAEIAGWLLIALGLAALILPGPGLLGLAAGLWVLSFRYSWAKRLLKPVKARAVKLATSSVKTWPRITASVLACLFLIGLGIYWGLGGKSPSWWYLRESWWLVGGRGTGITLIVSGALAIAMIVYSFIRFRPVMKV